jgi:ABC-type lipoprotein export system ATPase subunit
VLSGLDRDARAAFRRESIGVVGQVPGLSSALTARENVELSLALRSVDGVELHERTIDALAIVGLADHAERAVARLSAGERERVALARAIAAGPSLLIADEPTARLDSVTTLAIGGLLADLAREHGTTVVCATHDPLVIALAGAELRLGGAARVRSA